jgi:hypothetical protein
MVLIRIQNEGLMKKGSIFRRTIISQRVLPALRVSLLSLFLVCWLAGCGVINLGKWKGIEHTSSSEYYYLVKDIYLSPGASIGAKETFDHNVHSLVNLYFTPRNETNTYTAESIWYDPSDSEYRKIRETYDAQKEGKKGVNRNPKGTTRIMSIPTEELYNHKPGLWKVELYLEGKLVRRLTFTVR